MSLSIQILTPNRLADVAAIRSLEEKAFTSDRLSYRSLRQLMASPSAHIFTAVTAGTLVGAVIVLFRRNSQSARIYSLAVDPLYRRLGVASRLIGEAIALASREGKTSVHLEVRVEGHDAIRLYTGLGFAPYRERQGYYADGSTALCMRRSITPWTLRLLSAERAPLAGSPDVIPKDVWGYQSQAYYEALIAEARGLHHQVSTRDLCDAWVPTLPRAKAGKGTGLAILCDSDDPDAPSDMESIRYLRRIASSHRLPVEIIAPGDLKLLPEFGALWIRSYTSPQSISYIFARHAEELGLPVLDNSASIRHCSNKIFMAERLRSSGIPTPRTLCVSRTTSVQDIENALAYPVVLKVPDGAFSKSVSRADSRSALELLLIEMLNKTTLVIAQEYIPTSFDWRIGLLDGEPLFACQYHMVRGHWQILKHVSGEKPAAGRVQAVPLMQVPEPVLRTAAAASRAMGSGLHGVDIKQTPWGIRVIEVNDNPDLNHGFEDSAEGDTPWLRLLAWFQEKQFNDFRNRVQPWGGMSGDLRQLQSSSRASRA